MKTKTKKKASKAGRPVLGEPLEKVLTFRLSVDEMEALKTLAANTNHSTTYVVRHLMSFGLAFLCSPGNVIDEDYIYFKEFYKTWGVASHILLERDERIKKLELEHDEKSKKLGF